MFDPSIIAQSGVSGRIAALGDSIGQLIDQLNKAHAAKTGEDLFKATNKTTQALLRIRKPAKDLADYESLIDELYFLFRESVGTRLNGTWPTSFAHVNDLRTEATPEKSAQKDVRQVALSSSTQAAARRTQLSQ